MAHPKAKSKDLPEGWSRIGLQVPDSIAAHIDAARNQLPARSMKLLGTAAMSIFAALDDETRYRLYLWAHRRELEPETAKPNDALEIVVDSLIKQGRVSR